VVVSLGYVGTAAVLDIGILGDEDAALWRRAWKMAEPVGQAAVGAEGGSASCRRLGQVAS
jgi:hypothetical protein